VKITAVRITPLYTPYRAVRRSTWNARTGVLSLFVEIQTDAGLIGHGDTLCKQSLRAGQEILDWAGCQLVGRDPLDIEATAVTLRGLGSWAFKHELSWVCGPLLAAIDVALWDLLGKAAGQPVTRLLGGPLGHPLHLALQVPTQPLEELEAEAEAGRRRGFRYFSMKLAKSNRSVDEDVESVRTLRRIVGDDAVISADVNGAWSVPTAVGALRRLEPFGLAYVETPVIGLANMAALRGRVGVPIAVDEEGCSLPKLLEVIRLQAADVLVIDLPALGGITGLRKAAALAEVANLPAVVHGNGEQLAAVAALHVAAAAAPFKLFGHQYYFELGDAFVDELVPDAVGPVFAVPSGPGLGVTVSPTRVATLRDAFQRVGADVDYVASVTQTVPTFPKY
jgi:L-alanine-DL-glutamate epimerase-like enolase superfamily enzyme